VSWLKLVWLHVKGLWRLFLLNLRHCTDPALFQNFIELGQIGDANAVLAPVTSFLAIQGRERVTVGHLFSLLLQLGEVRIGHRGRSYDWAIRPQATVEVWGHHGVARSSPF